MNLMKNYPISVLAGAAFAALGASAAAATTIFLDDSNVIATGSKSFLNRLPIQLPTISCRTSDEVSDLWVFQPVPITQSICADQRSTALFKTEPFAPSSRTKR
jgi:hypothetical protein